jgi:hypothetical protein
MILASSSMTHAGASVDEAYRCRAAVTVRCDTLSLTDLIHDAIAAPEFAKMQGDGRVPPRVPIGTLDLARIE